MGEWEDRRGGIGGDIIVPFNISQEAHQAGIAAVKKMLEDKRLPPEKIEEEMKTAGELLLGAKLANPDSPEEFVGILKGIAVGLKKHGTNEELAMLKEALETYGTAVFKDMEITPPRINTVAK